VKKEEVLFSVREGGEVKGDMTIPDDASVLILFSHGSGSSRLSSRNRFVAAHLNDAGYATLLMDLLTPEEDQKFENRFDIGLLTNRLVDIINHFSAHSSNKYTKIGLFGASTGAASALRAAALLGDLVGAVVSRGGRPDLAAAALGKVNCPVLLIVGSLDEDVLMLNREAMAEMSCTKELSIVDGATHLFEEPGKLEEVAELARQWFDEKLPTD
jgi:putative phosphoribosyl transferase